MDKYEYKLKTEEMLELMEDGEYRKAAAAADLIDWKRVRNIGMLMNVSDIYEKSKEYQKSYDVLNLAYRRAEGSRKVIYKLCSLAIKTRNIDEAIDYYDEFIQIAPKDPNRHILRYQILRAQRAPLEQQIEALEEFKKAEYIEEWAYELAKLYQEAGMTAECLEECDDLILWFSEGKYVYKAMELKMQYKPLSPSQQEKYDHRYEKISSETEEMPDLAAYMDEKEAQGESASEEVETLGDTKAIEIPSQQEPQETEPAVGVEQEAEFVPEVEEPQEPEAEATKVEEDLQVSAEEQPAAGVEQNGQKTTLSRDTASIPIKGKKKPVKKKLGDTMRLDEALQQLLNPKPETVPGENEEPDLTDLEEDIAAIEDVEDLEIVNQMAEEKKAAEEAEREKTVPTGMKELIPDPELEEEELEAEEAEPEEEVLEAEEAEPEEEVLEAEEAEPEEEVLEAEEAEPEEEVLEAEEAEPEEEVLEAEEAEPEEEVLEAEEAEPEEVLEVEEAETEEAEPEEELLEVEEAEPEEVIDDEEEIAEVEQIIAETDVINDEKDSEGVTVTENMDSKKKEEPILSPEIQRLIDEIEGVIPEEDAEPIQESTPSEEEPMENMGALADELRLDDESDEYDWDDAEELEEYDDAEDDLLDAYTDADDDLFGEEDGYEDLDLDAYGYEEDDEDEVIKPRDLFTAEDKISEDDLFSLDSYEEAPDFEEEFRVNPEHSAELDDREIPDEDDGIDIMSATTPLSRKETAKMIATGKTSPLPLDEISDAMSMSDTGFIVHGRYDLETQSGIGTRAGLTEEQKKLFSYFVPVRGMSEQLVDVLEQDKNCTNRRGTSRTGNLLIIGNKGNGKTVLAVDVVKAIQKQRDIRQGKVAIVTGESLNKKKIGDIFRKLYGGALIIEKAGKMNEKTLAKLNKAMEQDTGELLVVLEEQRKPLDRLLSSNREFRRKFTSRLEVPIFINDELVTFGQTYAQENGYRIDEMGILALYSRIDSLQREDHAVTVAEVKEVMDEAIAHSQKASAKKLMKRVFGKNTDSSDRILLSEKDFNV